jgi:hypothetical protein
MCFFFFNVDYQLIIINSQWYYELYVLFTFNVFFIFIFLLLIVLNVYDNGFIQEHITVIGQFRLSFPE